ncbi:MAG: DUF6671 family protein [Flavobacterium sp.]|uniref:DUF6671 family protein n=1 Tax=Flavobacterium sp. TaxID=239 RepID=UPI003266417B
MKTLKQGGYDLFKGRTLIVATMHKKENVIAPILEKELSVYCKTIPDLNTDNFGTFSGEIERKDTPIETVKAKALAALEKSTETLVLASEGSFGSHPSSPFISANEEIVVLIDTKNNLEIRGWHLTTTTNFNHQEISTISELIEFAERIGFPDHNVIIKTNTVTGKIKVWKNFESQEELKSTAINLLKGNKSIHIETDMRAMNNPTRLKAIENAVIDLVKNIKSLCPCCKMPGFSIVEAIRGLKCSLCNLPTKSVKAYIYKCKKCDYFCERAKENVSEEDPMYCDFCNP